MRNNTIIPKRHTQEYDVCRLMHTPPLLHGRVSHWSISSSQVRPLHPETRIILLMNDFVDNNLRIYISGRSSCEFQSAVDATGSKVLLVSKTQFPAKIFHYSAKTCLLKKKKNEPRKFPPPPPPAFETIFI